MIYISIKLAKYIFKYDNKHWMLIDHAAVWRFFVEFEDLDNEL